MTVDERSLADLVTFARLEVEAGDIEPWAAVLAQLRRSGTVDDETALWAVKLYNAYDDIGSAWRVMADWPTPAAWVAGTDHSAAATYSISGERRNLFGGRVIRHLNSYTGMLAGGSQRSWIGDAIPAGLTEGDAFDTLMPYLQHVWGVGRLSSFEWAEFCGKVGGFPVDAQDAYLWQSSGPRESLERLYGNPTPTPQWLNARGVECRAMLADAGLPLSWWDVETVICDFNVMRKGRYYPGKHIAMIRQEIEGLPDPARSMLRAALRAVVPEPWCDIPPGADKALARAYRETGVIHTPLQRSAPL